MGINNKKDLSRFVGQFLQTWIRDCLKMYGRSDKVIKSTTEAMKNRKMELTARGKSLAEVKIQKGIFKGDAILQLFFVIAMMLQIHIQRNLQNYKKKLITLCHHHHIVLAARISLTLSRHSSLSFIALGRSSGQQPVSSHSCWMYVRAGRPAFARPCVGMNWWLCYEH